MNIPYTNLDVLVARMLFQAVHPCSRVVVLAHMDELLALLVPAAAAVGNRGVRTPPRFVKSETDEAATRGNGGGFVVPGGPAAVVSAVVPATAVLSSAPLLAGRVVLALALATRLSVVDGILLAPEHRRILGDALLAQQSLEEFLHLVVGARGKTRDRSVGIRRHNPLEVVTDQSHSLLLRHIHMAEPAISVVQLQEDQRRHVVGPEELGHHPEIKQGVRSVAHGGQLSPVEIRG